MHFDFSELLTREIYVQIIRKVLAAVRHEAYTKIQDTLAKEHKEKLTQEELDSILENIQNHTQELYREKALELFKIKVPAEENAKRMMQKAYLVYSTVSSIKQEEGQPVIRSRWQDQISAEHKVHSEILTKLQNGERVEGIEKDPLESAENDY
jgi:hypothetical protein